MKKGLKKTLPLFFIILMLFASCPGGIWAEEAQNAEKPSVAALNPAFVQYMDELKQGTLRVLTESGHPLGHIPAPQERYQEYESMDIASMLQSSAFPASYDLRSTGRVTAIRDQDPYGSCWTFASLGSLESYLKQDVTVDLSENNLMRNHGFDWGLDDGGNSYMATAYMARWNGPVSESIDPYGSFKKTGLSPAYHVQEVTYISQSPEAIKQALMEGGALDMAMYAAAFDSDAYYNSDETALYYDGNDYADHDVVIVGWDDNFDRNKFSNTPPGNGAWIIRNSWGTDWGDGGYFYMSYYDTFAGSDVAAFHNAEATDNYRRIYQYDPLGDTQSMGYDNETAWGANIFTAAAGENLTAVSTYALSPDTTLEINIYTDVSPGEPRSGTLRSSQVVTIPQNGYYTIGLDSPVVLQAGQKFSVAIKYITPGNDRPLPVEMPVEDYSSAASANPGESFSSHAGIGNWEDLSATQDSNVCIKAFTEDKQSVVAVDCFYRTHVQNDGWQDWRSNGVMSGTSAQSLRLEGIEIKLASQGYDLGIEYSTHVENIGWQDPRSDGVMSGTSGKGLRLEAIKINLKGADMDKFDVYYRVHAQNVGWMGWAKNGAECGTAGFGYRLEGIEIQVVPKGDPAPGSTQQPFLRTTD